MRTKFKTNTYSTGPFNSLQIKYSYEPDCDLTINDVALTGWTWTPLVDLEVEHSEGNAYKVNCEGGGFKTCIDIEVVGYVNWGVGPIGGRSVKWTWNTTICTECCEATS